MLREVLEVLTIVALSLLQSFVITLLVFAALAWPLLLDDFMSSLVLIGLIVINGMVVVSVFIITMTELDRR